MFPLWWNKKWEIRCIEMTIDDKWLRFERNPGQSEIVKHYSNPATTTVLRAIAERIEGGPVRSIQSMACRHKLTNSQVMAHGQPCFSLRPGSLAQS